jgi:hypothetical protein
LSDKWEDTQKGFSKRKVEHRLLGNARSKWGYKNKTFFSETGCEVRKGLETESGSCEKMGSGINGVLVVGTCKFSLIAIPGV